MRTEQLLLFCLLLCQNTESLTDKWVILGQNVTLDCQIGNREIYWFVLKLPDPPVVILRTFGSESTYTYLYQERFKDKYSAQTHSRLFIINVSIDELGIYYCAKTGSSLELSDGTRLSITEEVRDQNQTQLNNSKCQNASQSLMLLYFIPNIVMFLAIIGLLLINLHACKKSHRQCPDDKLELLYNTNGEEFSEVEFHLFRPTNNTFGRKIATRSR